MGSPDKRSARIFAGLALVIYGYARRPSCSEGFGQIYIHLIVSSVILKVFSSGSLNAVDGEDVIQIELDRRNRGITCLECSDHIPTDVVFARIDEHVELLVRNIDIPDSCRSEIVFSGNRIDRGISFRCRGGRQGPKYDVKYADYSHG